MTTRAMTAGAEAASQAEVNYLVVFIELDFASGFVRLNSTERDIEWSGKTWTAGAGLGHIGPIEESSEMESDGLEAVLNAGPAASLALGERFRGRPARLWLGYLDADWAVIPDPVLEFAGRMDRMPITFGAAGRVLLRCVNRLVDWKRSNTLRFTAADQRALFPGDAGCDPASETAERSLPWGRPG